MVDFPTLASLEALLGGAGELAARGEREAVAEAIREAARLCESARTVQASTHIQLQGALASIRAGRPDEAAALIERAVAIGQRWPGAPVSRHEAG
jgi:Arc/MetJ-type ribon-helix-helix transcriptional regulator